MLDFGLSQQNNTFLSNSQQLLNTGTSQSAHFSDPMNTEIEPIEMQSVSLDSDWNQTIGDFTFDYASTPNNNKISSIDVEFSEASEHSDFITGKSPSVNQEAVLYFAVTATQDQLESFIEDEQFLDEMKLAFGDDWSTEEAEALIEDLANGEAILEIEILSNTELNANGAFAHDTIYLSEQFLSNNATNPEAIESVLLEEIGHHVDYQLNSDDSVGDEGELFAKLVRNETISETELASLKSEDDSGTIIFGGKETIVELAEPDYPGYLFEYEEGEDLSYDENVEIWQQQMKDLGYDLDVDGLYGSQSEGVARQFQEDEGLEDVDGIVGPDTWEASFASGSSDSSYPGYLFKYEEGEDLSYDENVEIWQQQMKDLGYDLDVDGLYGSQSEGVARQFQEDEGLEDVDGIVGPDTWEASFADSSSAPEESPSEDRPEPTDNFGDNIAAIAQEEWEFFDKGNLEETEDGAWQRIVEYWNTQGINDNFGVDTPEEVGSNDYPWSAVFISWVMDRANVGDKFEYSASHSIYITDAIQDKKNNDSEAAFFGYKLDEYSPKVGDLVGYSREEGVDYNTPATYKSHTDIVVDVRDGEIDVIGGNVANSVTKKTLKTDSQGRLIDKSEDWFVVLSNQIDASGSSKDNNLAPNNDLIGTADPLYPDYSEREEITPDPNYSDYSGQITVSSDIDANTRAFLDTISYAEGTYNPDGYRTIFGGDTFESFEDHPRVPVPFGDTYSTAAGRYQFLEDTWDGIQSNLNLSNFSPENQDLAAVELIKGQDAIDEVESGNFEEAIEAVNDQWASLPGSPYGQPTKSLEELQGVYEVSLRKYENT